MRFGKQILSAGVMLGLVFSNAASAASSTRSSAAMPALSAKAGAQLTPTRAASRAKDGSSFIGIPFIFIALAAAVVVTTVVVVATDNNNSPG